MKNILNILFFIILTFFACLYANGQDKPAKNESESIEMPPPPPPPLENENIEILPALTIVEEMPQFPGGEEALYKYLVENLTYPQTAKEKGIQGKVWITFVVEKDGSITDVRIMRDIGGGCGEEAMRVVRNMPKWKPGKQNGVLVRVQFNLPVSFTLT